MDFIENSCRVCLTSEEEVKFKPMNDEIVRKISMIYKLSIDQKNRNILCKQCEQDINTASNVFNRIQDAGDYFELYAKQKETGKSNSGKKSDSTTIVKPKDKLPKQASPNVVYECDACQVSFKDMKSLNEHMTSHNAFACFFCKSAFASALERHTHLEMHHKEKTEKLIKLTAKTALEAKRTVVLRPRKLSI